MLADEKLREGTCPEGIFLEMLPNDILLTEPVLGKFKTVKQTLSPTDTEGVFVYSSRPGKTFSLENFEKKDITMRKASKNSDSDFWCDEKKTVFYGADLSFQSNTMHVLNDTGIYQHIPEAQQEDIPGVNTPYSYVGLTGSFFPLHKVCISLLGVVHVLCKYLTINLSASEIDKLGLKEVVCTKAMNRPLAALWRQPPGLGLYKSAPTAIPFDTPVTGMVQVTL